MIEVLHRSAMGRIVAWRSEAGTLTSPAIAFVHTSGRPAPPFAEVRVTADNILSSGVTFALQGSVFAPRDPGSGIPVPPSLGLPLHAGELEIPDTQAAGPVAVVRRPADVAGADAKVLILDNGPEFLLHARRFVRLLVDVREAAGPARLLWLPGVAAPENLAVLAYCGIDIVDSARMRWDGARGGFHTIDGLLPADDVDAGLCDCDGCTRDDVILHNETALDRELRTVRQAIRNGTLRELSERRAVNEPWSIAVLRHLDLREFEFQEPFFPVVGGRLRAYTPAALTRPEVERFRRRLLERTSKPPGVRVAVLLPCSARKPYSTSKSHRRFREAIRRSERASLVHEVIVTSPFGVVPRELEGVHPVRSYDVSVTGDWGRDEGHVVSHTLSAYLQRNSYSDVIANLGPERPFVAEAAPDAVFVARDSGPTSVETLTALAAAVHEATEGFDPPSWALRRVEDMTSLAEFQFGPTGRDLLRDAVLRGRPESVRIFRGGHQLGSLTERGQISLTLAGASILAENHVYSVEIEDFYPAGNVFAVGVVDATSDIRIGDDVVVVHGGEVRGVGTARMPWREMVEAERGEAVRIRHRMTGRVP